MYNKSTRNLQQVRPMRYMQCSRPQLPISYCIAHRHGGGSLPPMNESVWRDFYYCQQSSVTALHRRRSPVICTTDDDRLFAKVTCNTQHLLHELLPSLRVATRPGFPGMSRICAMLSRVLARPAPGCQMSRISRCSQNPK